MTDPSVQQMAKENPYRFQEYLQAVQRADNDLKARVLEVAVAQSQLQGQQQAAFAQYAAAEDAKFDKAHPEFSGEKGRQALARLTPHILAELRDRFGATDEQITPAWQNEPQFARMPRKRWPCSSAGRGLPVRA